MKILQFRVDLRVDDREGVRQFGAGFMMIGDDHVDSAGNRVADGVAAGDAAVDGDEHLAAAEGIERLLKRFRGEAVTVVEAVRDEGVNLRAVLTKYESEQCACGDSVGIVIAVNKDRFLISDCPPEACRGVLNTREAVRIGEICQAGTQKIRNLFFVDSASGEEKSDRMGQRKLLPQRQRL